MAGLVRVGGVLVDKPGHMVDPTASIDLLGPDHPYVSRGGVKLEAALREFSVAVQGLTILDVGASTGGFTDCLLQHGVQTVCAIDTGYGALDYRLRTDARVIVMERTNALHADPPDPPVDLVTIDLAWTLQSKGIPAALRWVWPDGRIITLIKPHYEASQGKERSALEKGVLPESDAHTVLQRVLDEMPALGVDVLGVTRSPIVGGKGKSRRKAAGNIEFLALLQPRASP